MFQRLKGAIDSRIAEEQARQKALSSTPLSRSPSSSSKTDIKKDNSPKPKKEKREENVLSTQGADPSDFEKAFVIEDDEEMASKEIVSEVVTDQSTNVKEINSATIGVTESEHGDEKKSISAQASPVLSPEIRAKVRKLERLEAKYQELLRSYRIAHARATSIEVFEKQLREYTPLSTISDPDAFVEYLNQLKLKGDIVMDELKRITTDRDTYKNQLEESRLKESLYCKELAALKSSLDRVEIESVKNTVKISEVVVETLSDEHSEDLFPFDDEVPWLGKEIQEGLVQSTVLQLPISKSRPENSLIHSEENNSYVITVTDNPPKTLESISSALSYQEKIDAQTEEIQILKSNLEASEIQLKALKTDLAIQKKESDSKLSSSEKNYAISMQNSALQLENASATTREAETRCKKLQEQVISLEKARDSDLQLVDKLTRELKILASAGQSKDDEPEERHTSLVNRDGSFPTAITTGSNKKKGKKKKKGNVAVSVPSNSSTHLESGPQTPSADLEAEISKLQLEITFRDSELAKFRVSRKKEEDLQEEIENMQESLLAIGQEHVEAREKIKELLEEKSKLQEKITELEDNLDRRKINSNDTEKMEADLSDLTSKYEDLKLQSAIFQSDLGAAQQLAITRYKDLSDLRDVLQKIQPELTRLRAENSDIKITKEELLSRNTELKRSEAREKDLRSEIASFKKQVNDSQSEIRTLQEKLTLENNARLRAEDQQRVAQRDMRKSEAEKIQFAASNEKAALELEKLQEESSNLRIRTRDLGEQVTRLNLESIKLQEKLDLRTSQYEDAQALLGSMKNQVSEMAMQLKEAETQSELLSEELSEVQRLLSERTREGETMRRLLAEADGRAEAKFCELRNKLEAEIKERDLAEDETSTTSRRRAREYDELKNRLRQMEQDILKVTNEKVESERSEKEWKSRWKDLELLSSNLTKELDDTRTAMNQLRDALDKSEKALNSAEKQRLEIRGALDEANQRHDKLQKEYKTMQLKVSKLNDKNDKRNLGSKNVGAAKVDVSVDYVYLKTIMLQFLEHKDRNVQESLVRTVLKQLLKFDKKEQERWIAAISTH